jgi:hypothetical protein
MPEYVDLIVVFDCPNGHEITFEYTHQQYAGAGAELNSNTFRLECPVCGWKGRRRGSKRKSVRLAERSL